MRWLWLQKTEPNRPWAGFNIVVPEQIGAFFAIAIVLEVGDGANTLFWTDHWLHGQSIADLAPRLMATIPAGRRKKRIVQEALINHTWVSDTKGGMTVGVLGDYLHLWDILSNFQMKPEVEDRHIWRSQPMGYIMLRQPMRDFS